MYLTQSDRNRQNFTKFICSGSGRDDWNGGVCSECEYGRERCPLEQHEYLWGSFKGEIALYRSVRQQNETVLLEVQLF